MMTSLPEGSLKHLRATFDTLRAARLAAAWMLKYDGCERSAVRECLYEKVRPCVFEVKRQVCATWHRHGGCAHCLTVSQCRHAPSSHSHALAKGCKSDASVIAEVLAIHEWTESHTLELVSLEEWALVRELILSCTAQLTGKEDPSVLEAMATLMEQVASSFTFASANVADFASDTDYEPQALTRAIELIGMHTPNESATPRTKTTTERNRAKRERQKAAARAKAVEARAAPSETADAANAEGTKSARIARAWERLVRMKVKFENLNALQTLQNKTESDAQRRVRADAAAARAARQERPYTAAGPSGPPERVAWVPPVPSMSETAKRMGKREADREAIHAHAEARIQAQRAQALLHAERERCVNVARALDRGV